MKDRELACPIDELAGWLSNIQWSALESFAHNNNNEFSRLYLYLCVYLYICSGDNQRKLGHQFKRKTGGV